MPAARFLPLVLVFLLPLSCGDGGTPPEASETAAPESRSAPPAKQDNRPLILAFGDSLSAGYGVDPGESYPDFLQQLVNDAGYEYRVVNAGISGDTTSSGLARSESAAAMKPAIVILELGGNDGLRGLPIEATRDNLDRMIRVFQESGSQVVLAGMTLPPNYGPEYIERFEQVYEDLAAKYNLPLIPFLLEGVADNPQLMQGDGIHPTVEGNRIAARNVFEVVKRLLKVNSE